ncbi:hypothetical protein [Runella salmonicolor]|uniref:Uncharacterized protein n=1 Tax=Runella salmonicolor TaxID=2950278 RepID=A0ABT1FWM8_9BACT|nr:hypothetical protein [Runella salmonicolor]MCP1386170.1 hypothetical protein [Runella salmonicolor]
MTKELTPAQIDELYAFVKRKGVDYYDLQLELVDHLASEIEQKREQHPGLTFERALESVYAGFGIFGFTEVVEKAHVAVARRSNKLWWSFFKQFWKLPRLFFTIALIGFIWGCFLEFGVRSVIIVNGILVMIRLIHKLYELSQKRSKRKLTPRTPYGDSPVEVVQSPFILQYLYFFSENITLPHGLLAVAFGLAWVSVWASFETEAYFIKEQKRLYPQAFA